MKTKAFGGPEVAQSIKTERRKHVDMYTKLLSDTRRKCLQTE